MKQQFLLTFLPLLFLPTKLYLAECKRDVQINKKSDSDKLEALVECFSSITVPGQLCLDGLPAFILGNKTNLNKKNAYGIPHNQITIISLATGKKLFETAGYLKEVYKAKQETSHWCLDHDDETITYIARKPITCDELQKLNTQERELLQKIVQQDPNHPLALDEQDAKQISALPQWYQHILRLRYGVKFTSMLNS